MRILHFSDTHLGFNDLEILSVQGINQREADFYDAFTQVIDAVLETRPDYVIHTGDLFHRPHPSNRAISFCLSQLKRLSVARIPTIIIAGNHSTPRTRSASPILAALRTLDHIFPVFEEAYEKVIFDNINFHCIPHINDEEANLAAIGQCEASVDEEKHNVMMLHCSVGAQFMMEEYGERVYPRDKEGLFEKMDYVALGHWHGFGSVGKHPNVYYAGSTERTSSADTRNDKGYALITLGDSLEVVFHPIRLRPSHRLRINAQASADIFDDLRILGSSLEIEGALLTITLENLSATQSIDISNRDIEACFPTALNVQIQRKFRRTESAATAESVNAASLQEYFGAFLEEQTASAEEAARLNAKVATLFARYDEVTRDA
ncbi:metallophosphoesterase [Sulfuricurvum kujiense DSM 16994]|uniref:Metallophosphoesterase n=1 Tax=Sulfuricurvum kujiense (strain ATCC BAA-921 / DSM 16994 / JCM 11577 / YK-1) TaxID=709032 RepID=E4TX32_SULKY|nr:exonuclease SbcCD subunit D [Sulfuricurvum kujiense]ADR33873.1 metallophosphoesterase [Sulfuricurvum kujiense DSM 16994]